MSEFDALIDDFTGPLADPSQDEGPLSDESFQYLNESMVEIKTEEEHVEPPSELRVLGPKEIPQVGVHYVIFGGKPMPVVQEHYKTSEDEHVKSQIWLDPSLKDSDGNRAERAKRTLRMRYRGYLCGELKSL